MAKKIQPMCNGVLLKALDSETKSPGGIHLPSSAKRAYKHAVVHAVGPGRILETGQIRAVDLKVGDEVLIPSSSSTIFVEIDYNGEKLILLEDISILARIVCDSPE